MSLSLYKLLTDQLRYVQLQMMKCPIGSGERYVWMQDARAIKRRLIAETISA